MENGNSEIAVLCTFCFSKTLHYSGGRVICSHFLPPYITKRSKFNTSTCFNKIGTFKACWRGSCVEKIFFYSYFAFIVFNSEMLFWSELTLIAKLVDICFRCLTNVYKYIDLFIELFYSKNSWTFFYEMQM